MIKNNIMDFTEEQLDSIYDNIEKEFKDGKYNNVCIIGLGSTSLTNVSKSIIPMALSYAENEMSEIYNDCVNKTYAFLGDSEHELKENKTKLIAKALEEIDNAYVILLNTIESDEDDIETIISLSIPNSTFLLLTDNDCSMAPPCILIGTVFMAFVSNDLASRI